MCMNVFQIIRRFAVLVFFALFWCQSASATFSIVACDQQTGQCGVAIATHNLAVGHGAPFAITKLGAGVSQFETNPCHARAIIAALRAGANADTALKAALKSEKACPDGADETFRQIGVVSFNGTASAYTGAKANSYAGQRAEGFVSVQGNGLASDIVLDAMWECFHTTKGTLAERLLTALEEGYHEGGQSIGVMSAALIVATPEGWPVDINLRVDFAPSSAVRDLRTAYNANYARQLMFRGERAAREGDIALGRRLIDEALIRAPMWDRIWLRAAQFSEAHNDKKAAQYRRCRFQSLNPVWANMLKDEIDFTSCSSAQE